jgi:hypothetical protein
MRLPVNSDSVTVGVCAGRVGVACECVGRTNHFTALNKGEKGSLSLTVCVAIRESKMTTTYRASDWMTASYNIHWPSKKRWGGGHGVPLHSATPQPTVRG